jgi:hypothetical protein
MSLLKEQDNPLNSEYEMILKMLKCQTGRYTIYSILKNYKNRLLMQTISQAYEKLFLKTDSELASRKENWGPGIEEQLTFSLYILLFFFNHEHVLPSQKHKFKVKTKIQQKH